MSARCSHCERLSASANAGGSRPFQPPLEPTTSSFRDPAGRLLKVGPRILRVVERSGARDLDAFLATPVAARMVAAGRLVQTRRLAPDEARAVGLAQDGDASVVEHDAIPFPSYPYEWPPEMLCEAGMATLDIAEEILAEGYGLKDATPYNVLFRGPKPVFVDLLSFEQRAPGDASWLPYAQFIRTFLLPLLVNARFGTPLLQVFLHRRDGLEPEEVYPLFGLRKFLPPVLTLVTLPVWLAGSAAKREASAAVPVAAKPAAAAKTSDPEKARFILGWLFRSLRKRLASLARRGGNSKWSDYMDAGKNNYTESFLAEKERFVTDALAEVKPASVLDVGGNTGHFSAIAAKSGARVVAIDYDPECAGRVWRRARAENLDILPLVVDLTRPTPAVGWRNREQTSFLDRAKGHFDLVLMLAVIHHMLVSERIPLDEILSMAAQLTKDAAVIEYIGPGDSMFKRIARGRDALHADLTEGVFEKTCAKHFRVVRSIPTGDHRRLYLLRK